MKIKLPDPRTREGLKTIVHFVVARATSICVSTVIIQNVDTEELSTYKTAGVLVGSHVLGEMAADATKPFVDKKIDEYADMRQSVKDAVAEIKSEIEAQRQ